MVEKLLPVVPADRMFGTLHVQPVSSAAFSWPISTPSVRIGRDPQNNDLVCSDGGVSRRHVRLDLRHSGPGDNVTCTLQDLGSANGTTVDGRAVQTATLSAASVVMVGDTTLRFEPAGAGGGGPHVAAAVPPAPMPPSPPSPSSPRLPGTPALLPSPPCSPLSCSRVCRRRSRRRHQRRRRYC